MTGETRTETDSFGPIEVPSSAYWGAQTQRSITNFPFPAHERMPMGILHALALVKQAASRVNRKYGLDAALADAIEAAAAEVVAGKHDDQFPLTIWQTGSGGHQIGVGRTGGFTVFEVAGHSPAKCKIHASRLPPVGFEQHFHEIAVANLQRFCPLPSVECCYDL